MDDILDSYDGNDEYAGVEQTIEQDELYDVGHEYDDGAGWVQQSTEQTQCENHEDDDGVGWVQQSTERTQYKSHEDDDGVGWVHNPTITTEYESHADDDGARWVHNTTITTEGESHESHGGVDGVEQSKDDDPSDIGTLIELLQKFDYDDGRVEKVAQSSAQDDGVTDDVEPGTGQCQPFDLSTLEDASKGLAKFEVEKDSYKSPKVCEDLARQDDDITNDVEPGKGQYHPFDLSTLEDASKGLAKFDLAKFDSVENYGRVEKVEQGTGKSIPSSWVSGKKPLKTSKVLDDDKSEKSPGQSISSTLVSGKKPLKTSKGLDDGRSEKSPGHSIPSTLVSGKKPLKTSKGLDDDRSEKSPGQSIPSSWVSGKPLKTSKGLDDGRSEKSQGQSIPSTLVTGKKPLKTSKGLDDARSEKSQGKFEVGKDSLVDCDKSLVDDLQGKIRVLWGNCERIIEDFTENFSTSKISPDTFDGDDPHEGGLIRVSHHLSTNLKRDPLYNDRLHHQNSFKSFQKFDDTILNLKNLVDIYTQGNGTGMSYPDFEIGNSIMLSQLSKEIDRFVDCEYWIDVWIHYAFIYWTLQQKPVLDYIVSASEDTEITKRVEYSFKTLQHPLTLKKLLGRLECHLQHLDKRSSTHRFPSGERALNHEYLVGNVHNNFVRLFHSPAFKELRKITKLDTKYGRLDENMSGMYKTTTTKDKM